jgi:hypothetical protein
MAPAEVTFQGTGGHAVEMPHPNFETAMEGANGEQRGQEINENRVLKGNAPFAQLLESAPAL